MTLTRSNIYVGTSGWSYNHWKENFYPKGMQSQKWLNHYSSVFSTVEVNTTFYHLPRQTTIENWHSQVPENFVFSLKASRYITHRKRLHECHDAILLFYKVIQDLKNKAGPILFQLPPSFKMNKERLIEFIDCLNNNHTYVFEFRHDSWFVDEIYELLLKNKIALCISDLNGTVSPEEITADFTYIRLHGPKDSYQGYYGIPKLKPWKNKIEKWATQIGVYCYFDNDEKGYAIQDAKTLLELL